MSMSDGKRKRYGTNLSKALRFFHKSLTNHVQKDTVAIMKRAAHDVLNLYEDQKGAPIAEYQLEILRVIEGVIQQETQTEWTAHAARRELRGRYDRKKPRVIKPGEQM